MGAHVRSTVYVYVLRSPIEIQSPARWNLIGRSMTVSSPVLSPSSILPAPSSNCGFITAKENSGSRVKKCCWLLSLFVLFKNYVSCARSRNCQVVGCVLNSGARHPFADMCVVAQDHTCFFIQGIFTAKERMHQLLYSRQKTYRHCSTIHFPSCLGYSSTVRSF